MGRIRPPFPAAPRVQLECKPSAAIHMGVARPIKVLDDGAAMVNVKNMETKIMKKKCFVGVDIAKKTFDAVIYEQGTAKASASSYRHFSNDAEGFSGLLSWLTSETGFKTGALVVGMENTGLYGYALCRFLEGERVDYCVFNPLALKRSLGLVRGKDDRVDAFRIARFTYQHRDCLRYSRLSGETVRKLKSLATERARLVRQLAANKAFATDHKSSEGEREQVGRALELAALIQTFIDRVEKDMEEAVKADVEVMTNYSLLTSIKGIGPVNAVAAIVSTDNFRAFDNPRQYACYIGVAPFPNTSGTSVRGRTRVSKLAMADIKAKITQAALSAITYDSEMAEYYSRKTGQGKHPASVLNAVKFKLICRMFAVIRRKGKYISGAGQYRNVCAERKQCNIGLNVS